MIAKVDAAKAAVYALTAKGRSELNAPGTSLSAAELKLMVMLDGKASVAQLEVQVQPLAPAVVADTLEKLARAGHIGLAGEMSSAGIDIVGLTLADETAAGLASLKKHGYFVKIARQAAQMRKLAKGEKITVLVVEDDPQLAKLLAMYFRMESMETRLASSRGEIAAALNQKPLPDLVLLDVVLPDVDGFEVLSRMRQHEAMKKIPVIMCTARATREAVLEGLQRGADGYVTKPFDVDVLMKAAKTVIGLP